MAPHGLADTQHGNQGSYFYECLADLPSRSCLLPKVTFDYDFNFNR
jgi:hypothetical protein